MRRVRASRTSRVTGLIAAIGVASATGGCGARSWLPDGEQETDAGVNPDANTAVDARVDATPLEAMACTGTSAPLVPRVPTLYFVLDASGSMAQVLPGSPSDKWTNVRGAVSDLIDELGPNASFGATVFPAPGTDVCAAGVEVMPTTLGDSLGVTRNAFLAATQITPNGGTPTAATFQALATRLGGSERPTYVILATDGGPNCDPNLTACSIDQCTRNTDMVDGCTPNAPPDCCSATDTAPACLDRDATVQAVSNLAALGVPTYVLGIPGSAPYAPVLDALAVAGGTARSSEPLYYPVDSGDRMALGAAVDAIALAAMRSCLVKLEGTPTDPSKVNVYVGGALVPSDGADGWTLGGRTVTLQGASCAAVQNAPTMPSLQVVEGCPTVH